MSILFAAAANAQAITGEAALTKMIFAALKMIVTITPILLTLSIIAKIIWNIHPAQMTLVILPA